MTRFIVLLIGVLCADVAAAQPITKTDNLGRDISATPKEQLPMPINDSVLRGLTENGSSLRVLRVDDAGNLRVAVEKAPAPNVLWLLPLIIGVMWNLDSKLDRVIEAIEKLHPKPPAEPEPPAPTIEPPHRIFSVPPEAK